MSRSLEKLPELVTNFPSASDRGPFKKHIDKGREILEQVFSNEFETFFKKGAAAIEKLFPLVKLDIPTSVPATFSLFFLFHPTGEVDVEKMLPEILRRWLIPEKDITVLSTYYFNFFMPEVSSKPLFLAEIQVLVEGWGDLSYIKEHVSFLMDDLVNALTSANYLEQVLDTKALIYDQKSVIMQSYLRKFASRFPQQFDTEIFREMSIFFALSSSTFQKFRLPKHLVKIIVSHYLMRRRLMQGFSLFPEKRQLELRFFRSKLYFPFGIKPVLGLSVSVGLIDRHENFEDTHVISAIQKFIPNIQIVKGSYYFYKPNHSTIKHLYLEIEKREGGMFSLQEIGLLKSVLADELKNRVEKLIPLVFMARNEEEIMRNILLLSQELKYANDLPQIMVNLDRQDAEELYFTVIVVRVLRKDDISLEEAFARVNQPFHFSPDRTQNVGYIRKKIPKEANVVHLSISKDISVLRADSSVNFYLARQKIVSIITSALGNVRDYNGGMLLKQGELLSQLKHAFQDIEGYKQELLEDFFFSLSPIEAQATASLESLEKLFKVLLECLAQEFIRKDNIIVKIRSEQNLIFAALRGKDSSFETFLTEELSSLKDFSKSLIKNKVFFEGTWLQGLIYETSNPLYQKQLEACIHRAIEKWKNKMASLQELCLIFSSFPSTLDPRMGGDDVSSCLMKMLFEGLTRISSSGEPELALAQSVNISSDQKRYTFKLRPSYWSNQRRLVAYDFEYSWKKVLSPSFYTSFAYFFYQIKNAKLAKEGRVSLNQVGIKAVDESTLVVDLENPTPEFLEFAAHALYSPVCERFEKLHPNWSQGVDDGFICNGPFKLKKIDQNGNFELVKNPFYWDQKNVKLDRIRIGKNESDVAHEMYKNDEIDWIGRPMQPLGTDMRPSSDDLMSHSGYSLIWCMFNTQRFPFNNLKIRQAFSYSIDRRTLVKNLPENFLPTISPLPLQHTSLDPEYLLKRDQKLAIRLFKEGLKELGISKRDLPYFSIITAHKQWPIFEEVIRQWKEILGIVCKQENYHFHILFSKLVKGEFQIASTFWKAWINNPTYTLSAFEHRSNSVNFSRWESRKYQEILDQAKQEVILEKRFELLHKAERVLLDECPVTAFCAAPDSFMHKKRVKDVIISKTNVVDFKYVSIARDNFS